MQSIPYCISHVNRQVYVRRNGGQQRRKERKALRTRKLTMTRSCYGCIEVQLQLMRNASVDAERVICFSVEILLRFSPNQQRNDQSDQQCEETSTRSLLLVSRIGLRVRKVSLKGLQGDGETSGRDE